MMTYTPEGGPLRDENDNTDALLAMIGRAVSELLDSGQPPHRENIVIRLQLMGAWSGSESVRALCIRAREFLVTRITH
ncbi:hypothetical protein [Erwinia billingiae]|uniref:hypothetical protein n=1 Tax=Erwinia billingiae TaxID=182337 RepID=UPI002246E32A|nr:hypothetical protein [Erwinia billingiae]